MSDYDIRPGGSLKLKGVVEGGVTKKKKKSEKSKAKIEKLKEKERVSESLLQHEKSKEASTSAGGSGRNSPSVGGSNGDKTEAERRFEEIQRRRMAERVLKLASKTHKDRVHEFNSKLEALSEHHDIPKVGPG